MNIRPVRLREANNFVELFHRHHKPVRGHLFSVGVEVAESLVGVVIVGRPLARHLDDGRTCEILRCCTDGTKNACSKLYAAAWKAAKAMGYENCVTYTQEGEPGISLRASGFTAGAKRKARHWDTPTRRRNKNDLPKTRIRWEIRSYD